MAFFSTTGLAIDLGTAFTSIFVEGRGMVLREPSKILVNRENAKDVLAVGSQANALLGRTAEEVSLVSPVVDGTITDTELAALTMLVLAERATGKRKPMEKVRLVVNLCQGATKIEQQALFQAMQASGAKRPVVLRTPMAAALGSGIDVAPAKGVMVVDIGAGATEIAVLSMNGLVATRCMRLGGLSLDEAIVRYFRREHGLIIGLRTAEDLKIDIGTALPYAEDEGDKVMLKGRNAQTGKPEALEVSSEDVRKALEDPLCQLVDALQSAFENTPAELAGDVLESGIHLTGGGANLHGLDRRIQQQTGVPVTVCEYAEETVITGLGRVATDPKLLAELIKSGAAEE